MLKKENNSMLKKKDGDEKGKTVQPALTKENVLTGKLRDA